jgi:hypothetical protein
MAFRTSRAELAPQDGDPEQDVRTNREFQTENSSKATQRAYVPSTAKSADAAGHGG